MSASGTIDQRRAERMAGSARLHDRARTVFPDGVTHDGRYMEPFSLYCTHAQGPRKWDVDGNEYVDYFGGHGALLLGHGHPAVTEAIAEQTRRGTHFGANHELEIEWGALLQRIVPSGRGGLVKFTSSGTEATMLAMRLARAITGRSKVIKFAGHFHGWHDYAIPGQMPPFDQPPPGVPAAVLGTLMLAPNNDLDFVERALDRPGHDVAAVILEPSGASYATVPLPEGFLERLRAITRKYEVILIFDEVVTGFRWSPGGVQGLTGITPDLTTMAKIVAGGLPGGAVAGRGTIMELLEFKDDPAWNRTKKVMHPGTYNANPLSAAAGVAAMKLVADPAVQREADALAGLLKRGLNEAFLEHDVPGFSYGESSIVNTVIGTRYPGTLPADLRHPEGVDVGILKQGGSRELSQTLHAAMMLEGMDLWHGAGAILSVTHSREDIERTVDAFDRALRRMKNEGHFANAE